MRRAVHLGFLFLIAGTALAQSRAPNDDLQMAIVQRDSARLSAFVRAGRSLDVNFNDGHTGRSHESPLTMAANRDFPDMIRMLLKGGADPNRRDASGRAPIHQARSAEVVRLLVQGGADPNGLDPRGFTAIASAVERGDLALVDTLLATGGRLDPPLKGTDLLTLAIERKQAHLVRPLLERGFDVRAQPSQAVWRLIESGDEEMAVLLIQRGSDPNARGASHGEPLLLRALFRQRYAVAQALLDAGADVKLVSMQLAKQASSHPPLLANLAAKGLNLNAVDANGHTPLSSLITDQKTYSVRAAGSASNAPEIPPPDNVARVKALLERGADPNITYRNATPLMLAIADPAKAGFVELLVKHGGRIVFDDVFPSTPAPIAVMLPGNPAAATDIPVGNYQGVLTGIRVGPLTWAAMHGRADVALLLLVRGEKAGAADRHLLYFTTALGQADAVPALLRYTREVNVSDRADVTPLMFAAKAGSAAAVRALLAAGARVNTRSDRDWPPLFERRLHHYIGGHSASRPALVGGYTALRAAREGGHAQVAQVLIEAGGRE